MTEWKPIETAPRDGMEVLICGGTYGWDSSTFMGEYPMEFVTTACYSAQGSGPHKWQGGSCGGHDEYFWYSPKYWQPLPEPVKE